ncbi:hypothetical protein [Halobacterium zhouii]|uniref:hypothetical protein n=1 Tax=Halobacterium zhouii TaxID=2902624 RepID=UPI001E39F179|nr:hypothetical protein [Halobacterium zhouii]
MSDRNDSNVSDYPEKLDDGSQILGVNDEGSVVYWDPIREMTISGDVRPDGDLSELREKYQLGTDQSLGDLIDRIEEEVGWSSLSEYANSVLHDGDEDTS